MDLFNDFSIGLFVWQTVLFLALLFLLRKYAWKPILSAVEEREEGIKSALDAADNAKKEMETLNADNERILREAKAERDSILKEAREIKDGIIAEAKTQATEEADKVLASAREQINNEKMAAITELKNQVASLSVDIAEKILKSELKDDNKQKEMVNSALEEASIN
ncbi:MAG: F0F1 ATP synthase subunit B [Flavobacteriales bacterium]|nr:F0F1 ATP synthase subunit B [Flavobacteriales bacterium]MBL6872722.1 F0F1 ATP synthase subunit B [Flavobacteriales bacterium]